MAHGAVWEVVGGAEKGGILVREGQDLKSAELPVRLALGALVRQLGLEADRLHYSKLSGDGPDEGWVSIRVKGKDLLTKADQAPVPEGDEIRRSIDRLQDHSGKALEQASTALAVSASDDEANETITLLGAALRTCCDAAQKAKLLTARGVLYWRWSQLGRACRDLAEASRLGHDAASWSLLALRLCLWQFPQACRLALDLHEAEAPRLVDNWVTAAKTMSHMFFAERAEFVEAEAEVLPGVLRKDILIPTPDGAILGLRLLLLHGSDGQPLIQRPLVLLFQGEDESVDRFCKSSYFEPWQAANTSVIFACFRGYGFSSGTPSHEWLRVDGDLICESLPQILSQRGLPWPWPGGLAVYGNSLGSRVACYLAGIHGEELFTAGTVLETAWCGSYGPTARPLPEPPRHMALAALGSNSIGDSRFGNTAVNLAAGALQRHARALLEHAGGPLARASFHFVHMRGNEDLLKGYGGRLLILHGDVDHVVPVDHARRLCDAAEAATRNMVLVSGKRQDSLRFSSEYVQALVSFFK